MDVGGLITADGTAYIAPMKTSSTEMTGAFPAAATGGMNAATLTAPPGSSGGERCNGSGRAAFFCQRVKTYFEARPFGRKTYF